MCVLIMIMIYYVCEMCENINNEMIIMKII